MRLLFPICVSSCSLCQHTSSPLIFSVTSKPEIRNWLYADRGLCNAFAWVWNHVTHEVANYIVSFFFLLFVEKLETSSLLPPPPSRPRPHSPHSQTMTGKQNVTVTPKLSDLSSYFHHLSGVQIKKAICIDLVTNWWHRACGYSEEILNFLQRDEE